MIDTPDVPTQRARGLVTFVQWYAAGWILLFAPAVAAAVVCRQTGVLLDGSLRLYLTFWLPMTAPVLAVTVLCTRAWLRHRRLRWFLAAVVSGALCLTCERDLVDRAHGWMEHHSIARRLGVDPHQLDLRRHLQSRIFAGTTTREQVLDLMRMVGARSVCRLGASEYYPFYSDDYHEALFFDVEYDNVGVVRRTATLYDSVRPPREIVCTPF